MRWPRKNDARSIEQRRAAIPNGVEEREEQFGDRTYLSVRYPVISESGEVFAAGAIHLDVHRESDELPLQLADAWVHVR